MQQKFTSSSKMNDLIKEDTSLLLTMTRFGFSLGFGDKTVKEVCMEKKVDEKTFLAVINFISNGYKEENINHEIISIDAVILYLRNAHDFFLDFKLPLIRKKLIEAIDSCVQEQPYRKMIMKFYDDYVAEVQKHMDYENETVFPYVLSLLEGKKNPRYNIAVFEKNHENIDSKLSDLKNILIKYFPAQQPNYLLNEVLFDLSACEKDLEKHNRVEDHFFVPITETLEKKLSTAVKEEPTAAEKVDNLTEREKEILVSVVKGLTNKEIANKLFLSTHTVISHRRNITRKLEIHSTAGLTIYAIVNKLVTLDEIKSVIE
ncbi:MAG: LuxR C-terminal-related transcriptional regulator [Paludibacter sp.]|nr:LuxR C-terminal-related transcriptional regulator [Paludibacter sp.]MDD4198077.1 LuxR C-terminal-related transcriptional regulator [Paludibacter sp.]MDD4427659.1 LuxR C-terminal-related transcriptional regulator [Paludibacter sp.]